MSLTSYRQLTDFFFFYIYVAYFNVLPGDFIFALIVTRCVSFVMSAPL